MTKTTIYSFLPIKKRRRFLDEIDTQLSKRSNLRIVDVKVKESSLDLDFTMKRESELKLLIPYPKSGMSSMFIVVCSGFPIEYSSDLSETLDWIEYCLKTCY